VLGALHDNLHPVSFFGHRDGGFTFLILGLQRYGFFRKPQNLVGLTAAHYQRGRLGSSSAGAKQSRRKYLAPALR
jgi:hypothetical protein